MDISKLDLILKYSQMQYEIKKNRWQCGHETYDGHQALLKITITFFFTCDDKIETNFEIRPNSEIQPILIWHKKVHMRVWALHKLCTNIRTTHDTE